MSLELSIVIPAFNEENRISNLLDPMLQFAEQLKFSWEIIVVNGASTDNTEKIVNKYSAKNNNIKLLNLKSNYGKGGNIKEGVLKTKGSKIIFSDADGATPPSQISKLLYYLDKGYDIVAGTRYTPDSYIEIPQGFYRKNVGKIYRKICKYTGTGEISDITCGFKGFSKQAGLKLFKLLKINDFGFDAEILFLAKKFDMKIKEVPIKWINKEESKLRNFKDPMLMLAGLGLMNLYYIFDRYNLKSYIPNKEQIK